jgi:hypothetical protein
MANTNAPFGFQLAGFLDGRTGSLGQSSYLIASGDTNNYFTGDPVALSGGYLTAATTGANEILGVFIGCEYYNSSVNKVTWSPYWPASTVLPSGQSATAYVIADPQATFLVQSSGASAVVQSNIGKNIDFAGASPSSPTTTQLLTGQSAAYVNEANISASTNYAFRLIGLVTAPPGAPGTDTTTPYNRVLVAFNNQAFRVNTGF